MRIVLSVSPAEISYFMQCSRGQYDPLLAACSRYIGKRSLEVSEAELDRMMEEADNLFAGKYTLEGWEKDAIERWLENFDQPCRHCTNRCHNWYRRGLIENEGYVSEMMDIICEECLDEWVEDYAGDYTHDDFFPIEGYYDQPPICRNCGAMIRVALTREGESHILAESMNESECSHGAYQLWSEDLV